MQRLYRESGLRSDRSDAHARLTHEAMTVSRRTGAGPDRITALLADPPHLRLSLPDGSGLEVTRMTRSPGIVGTSWSGRGRIRPTGTHLRRSLPVVVGIDSMSVDSGEIRISPATRHVPRWSARRFDRYFDLSHAVADQLWRALHAPNSSRGQAVVPEAVADGPTAIAA